MTRSITLGISGASGAIYGIRLLEALRAAEVETHLIITKNAQITITHETSYSVKEVEALATHVHSQSNMAACVSSGSHPSSGMIVAPCSMRSLAEIATGCTTTLLTRAADVCLKERRRLVLLTRESPLNLSHIRNMATVTEMGGVIAPPVPAFYSKPDTIEDIVNHTVGRVLDMFEVPHQRVVRWNGM
jgi:flavin prenyltransferase